MSRGDIEDTIVGIQRDEWLRQIEELKLRESQTEIVVSTHVGTGTTVYTEDDGSETILGDCSP